MSRIGKLGGEDSVSFEEETNKHADAGGQMKLWYRNGQRTRPGLLCAALLTLYIAQVVNAQSAQADPLPSWNDDRTKTAIVEFVTRVTKANGPEFVPVPERIAVFDNDGTLWSEQPIYFQFAFALDRVKALAHTHPEWKSTQPFKAVLEGDTKALAASGEKGLVELILATHTGMTTEDFAKTVAAWIESARHPRFKRPYTDLVYQPMLELLAYLRANGFKTYIVSGGTVEFMRAWTEKIYGIPPEQVVGSNFLTKFQMGTDGKPVLMREPELDFIDDKSGKPVAINRFIGRRPIACFGNSDGDREMLLWTTQGRSDGRPSFGLLVHHTDGEREYVYDRQRLLSGQLDKALDEAPDYGWVIADMKTDWNVVFPTATKQQFAKSGL